MKSSVRSTIAGQSFLFFPGRISTVRANGGPGCDLLGISTKYNSEFWQKWILCGEARNVYNREEID